MLNRERMREQLVLHEGLRLRLYRDTEGYVTLGVGYNVTSRGMDFFNTTIKRRVELTDGQDIITREEALAVEDADITRVEAAVRAAYPHYDDLDEVRQRVIIDLAFNMQARLLQFKKAIACANVNDWSGVAMQLYKSRWAYQVDDGPGGKFGRADRLAKMVLTGQDYTL